MRRPSLRLLSGWMCLHLAVEGAFAGEQPEHSLLPVPRLQ